MGRELDDINLFLEKWSDTDHRREDLVSLLPDAIERVDDHDERLADALMNPVAKGLHRSIEQQPKFYGDILYPVLAPAVRKAISQAFSSFLITIQKTLAATTTLSGIWLRIRSIATGVPYAQLALMHSLVYKVEHLYLIERDSGLAVSEVSDPETSTLDSDAVAAMFSAIESFVTDSFQGEAEDHLTDLKVGERTVWVAHGPKLMLAAVIMGDAPESFKSELYDMLDFVHARYAENLHDSSSAGLALDGVEEVLSPLLQEQVRQGSVLELSVFKKRLISGLALLLLGFGVFTWVSNKLETAAVQDLLTSQPGLIVTQLERVGEQFIVTGLKDPMMTLPEAQLAALGIKKDRITLNTPAYISLDPLIESKRLERTLDLPLGLETQVLADRLSLIGTADVAWLIQNEQAILNLSLSDRLDITRLWVDDQSVSAYVSGLVESDTSNSLALSLSQQSGCNGVRIVATLPIEVETRLRNRLPATCWLVI